MNDVGALRIKASIDVTRIKEGFSKLKAHLDNTKARAKSFTGDLTRMSSEASKLSNRLIVVGGTGVAAILNLAKGAPAVAGAMAQIQVQTERLRRELGTALKPAFDSFVSGYTKFVTFVGDHPDLMKNITIGVGALAGLRAMTALLGLSPSATLVAALLALGAYAGHTVGKDLGGKSREFLEKTKGMLEEIKERRVKWEGAGTGTLTGKNKEVVKEIQDLAPFIETVQKHPQDMKYWLMALLDYVI